jgi:hypothetical protein
MDITDYNTTLGHFAHPNPIAHNALIAFYSEGMHSLNWKKILVEKCCKIL